MKRTMLLVIATFFMLSCASVPKVTDEKKNQKDTSNEFQTRMESPFWNERFNIR